MPQGAENGKGKKKGSSHTRTSMSILNGMRDAREAQFVEVKHVSPLLRSAGSSALRCHASPASTLDMPYQDQSNLGKARRTESSSELACSDNK